MPTGFYYDLTKYKFIADEVEKGREKGRLKGVKGIVRKLLEKRFGVLPTSVTRRIAKMSCAEAEKLAMAVLDAKSLKDLFSAVR